MTNHVHLLLTPSEQGQVGRLMQALGRRYVRAINDPEETDAIRLHLQQQHLCGPDDYRRAVEAQLGRTIGPAKIGRPRKSAEPVSGA